MNFALALSTFVAVVPSAAQAPAPVKGVHAVQSSRGGVSLRFATPTVRETEFAGDTGVVLGLAAEGLGSRIEAGKPIVPIRRVLVEIPNGVHVSLLVKVEAESRVMTRPLGVAPRVATTGSDEPPTAAVKPTWDVDTPFARLETEGWFRDRRVASILIEPVKVESAAGGARVADLLQLQLVFGAAASGVEASIAREANGPFRRIQERSIVNFGAFQHAPEGRGSTTPPIHPVPPPASQPSHPPPPSPPVVRHQVSVDPIPQIMPLPRWILKLTLDKEGLYTVTGAQLAAAGVDLSQVAAPRLALFCGGRLVPIRIEGEEDGALAPTDRIFFYGEPASGPYTRVNAYYLAQLTGLPSPDSRMDLVDGTPNPQAPVAASFRHVARGEVNIHYWQQLPNGAGKDHWFWTKTIAPSTRDYGLEIPDPAIQGALDAEVRVSMHGYTDTPQSPDHHTRVSLNGVVVGDASWNGIAPLLESHATSPVNLLGGANIVSVEQLNDTGAIVDGIYCDYVEVSYDRLFWSVQDALTFSFRDVGPTSYLVRGFSTSNISVLEVTNPMEPRWISGSTVVAAGQQNTLLTTPGAPVASGGERRFYCVASPAIKTPLSIAPLAPAVHAGSGADYILIAPPELAAASAALASHRESQGLRVKLVTTTQVYDHYGFGVEGPIGIRRFLKTAYATWPAPAPSHVVLVGDATIDPLDYLSTGTKNILPFEFRQILTDGEIPSDHAYACVAGSDPLPELFVSRIPAIVAAEATGAISKIIQRDTSAPAGAWKTRVSHFCDKGGNFTYTLDALAQQYIPPGYTLTTTYADNFPTPAAMRAATLAELTGGGLIATYLGHGATGNWNTYLSTADTPTLTSGLQAPFTIAFNCLNGYFASPTTSHSLAEGLALEPVGGAIAVWACSGLGFLSQVAAISGFLYTNLFAGQTIGEATTAAKLDAYVQLGALEDNLWQYILFGDSATKFLVP